MIPIGYSEARGTLIYEKKLKSKISCQTPFKGMFWEKIPYVLWDTTADAVVFGNRVTKYLKNFI
jgi:hypothetical protein